MAETSTDKTRALTSFDRSALTQLTPPASPPPRPAPAPKFGLAWRIFLGIALVVIVVLGATLVVASVVARRAADRSIDRGLVETGARVSDKLAQERTAMQRLAQFFAQDPSFRALVGSLKTPGDSASLLDRAQGAAESIGASFAWVVDGQGIRIAKSDEPNAPPQDLSESALVSSALQDKPAQGFGVLDTTRLFQAVSVPIPGAGGALAGALVAGRFVDTATARQIGEQTGSDLVFYTVLGGKPRITIVPPKFGTIAEVRGPLESSVMSSGAEGKMDATGMMMTMGDKKSARINGTHYLGQRIALLSASHNEVGGFVALRDQDQELAGYYKLRNALLLAGAGGLLIAFLMSLAISRQIVRPVRTLVGAAQRAADGDYAAEIPAGTTDEIGTLADAFKRLLADLRDKQALVDFLQSASGGRTIALNNTITPTMQMDAMGGAAVLEPGQVLANRYEVKSIIGVGGMGMVYKANDRELGEILAIKTLKPDIMQQDPSALDRFKSEIRLARRISHRNVVRTHDLGETSGVYYITMEFVEGKSLKELIVSRGRLPVAVTLPIAKQLCRALEVAHEEGVIHRDIKPQNMVVEPDGVLKVMDFGIARLARRKPDAGHTQAGMVVGTPEYMAPEQLFGEEIDARADLYSVGVVLYECLTGRLPHEAATPMVLITKVLEETPRPPRELQPEIPARLSDIVMRTLSRDRDARPKSAAELYDLLERV